VAVAADATDAAAVTEMVTAARQRLGPVLVTVANASGPQGTVTVDDLSWEYVLGHLEFFAKSPLLLLQAALPAPGHQRRHALQLGSSAQWRR
jgi:NAD(P)-dependent dehydrogenase (short-subunit alcohol dehydrogenase family)